MLQGTIKEVGALLLCIVFCARYTRNMNRVAIIVALMLVPFGVFATTTATAQNLVFTKPIAPPENAYLAGGTVIVTSSVSADLVVGLGVCL